MTKNYYKFYIEKGYCGRCGKVPIAKGGNNTCDICSARKKEHRNKKIERGVCTNCGQTPVVTRWYCAKCAEKVNENTRAWRAKIKEEVLTHLCGGEKPYCAVCGITNIQYLTVDHINGGGAAHKRNIGSGSLVYHWLKRNNYPLGFQVLCWNHNSAKMHNAPDGWDEPYIFREL